MNKLNGIRLKHRKNTENSRTEVFPIPKKVKIPMSMTMGAPCTPLVKIGDEVKVGQKSEILKLLSVLRFIREFQEKLRR